MCALCINEIVVYNGFVLCLLFFLSVQLKDVIQLMKKCVARQMTR